MSLHIHHLTQIKWDDFGRLWEPLLSRVPLLATVGNHEIEPGEGPEPVPTFQAYNARYPMPTAESSSSPTDRLPTQPNSGGTPASRRGATNAYYATPLPGAFLITTSQYLDYTADSEQFKWFQRVASGIDRKKHPWLIVMHHVPLYNTLISHYVEGECYRKVFEPLYYKYGVDFVLTGMQSIASLI